MITLLFQNLHTRGDGGWHRLELPVRERLPLKYYMQQQIGLIGVRPGRALKLRQPDGSYRRIRMTYVPVDGDVVALTPREW